MDTLWIWTFSLFVAFRCRSVTDVSGAAGDVSNAAKLEVINFSEKRGQERQRKASITPYFLSVFIHSCILSHWDAAACQHPDSSASLLCSFEALREESGHRSASMSLRVCLPGSDWECQIALYPSSFLTPLTLHRETKHLILPSSSVLCWVYAFLHLSSSLCSFALVSDSPLCEN